MPFWLVPIAAAAEVDVSWARWVALQPPEPVVPAPPPGPVVVRRDVLLTARADQVDVDATWSVVGVGRVSIPVSSPVVVLAIVVNGRVAAPREVDGGFVIDVESSGAAIVRLRGTLPGDALRDSLALPLGAAAVGTVIVNGIDDGLVATLSSSSSVPVRADHRTTWTGADDLILSVGPEPHVAIERVLTAECGLGFTVDEASLTTHVRAVATLIAGNPGAVAVTISGAPEGAALSGDAGWTRQGDRFVLPEAGAIAHLDLVWTQPLPPSGRVVLPGCAVAEAFRTDHAVTVSRDGTVDVWADVAIPPVASSAVPEGLKGLVDGKADATYAGARAPGGFLNIVATKPDPVPALVVDVAQLTVATTDDRRALIRAQYAVRNDRAQALVLGLPEGVFVVSARVAGAAVSPSRFGSDLRLPLPRSAEVVDGLLSVSVEVVLVVRDTGWSGSGVVPLPTVDADVAVQRVLLHVPPGWTAEAVPGTAHVVDAFSEGEGIHYGFADEKDARIAEADQTLQRAIDAWMSGDVEQTKNELSRLDAIGAKNADISRLTDNLDKLSDNEETESERRVKEQAQARVGGMADRQQELLREADDALATGDAEKAAASYEEAIVLGGKLSVFEKKEDADVSTRNRRAAEQVVVAKEEAFKQKAAKAEADKPATEEVVVGHVDEVFLDGNGETGEGNMGTMGNVGLGVLGGLIPEGRSYQSSIAEPTVMAAPEPDVSYEVEFHKTPYGAPAEAPPSQTRDSRASGPTRVESRPAIRAVTEGGIVPSFGSPVLFEHLLLPPRGGGGVEIKAENNSRRDR